MNNSQKDQDFSIKKLILDFISEFLNGDPESGDE